MPDRKLLINRKKTDPEQENKNFQRTFLKNTETEEDGAIIQRLLWIIFSAPFTLLSMLDLIPTIREETFSRFIRQCELAWPDGSAPVQVLFSKEARLAWVASTAVLFVRNFPKVTLQERLDKYRGTKTRRGHGRGGVKGSTKHGGKTFEEFVREANERAGTSWEEVLKQFETRMLKENDHGKKD